MITHPYPAVIPCSGQGHPTHAEAIAYFSNVIANAWREPTPDNARAKAHLDYFCGHIFGAHGLKDFIPFPIVSAHYTALHPAPVFDSGQFSTALRAYLSLLNVDFQNGAPDSFRGAVVSLTFDRGRHSHNIARFSVPALTLGKSMVRAPARTR